MPTNATTQRYAVIGHPVAHSLSPVMHNANFRANGDDAIYEREDIAPADLEKFIFENPKNYSGLSVTIPHKETLFELLTRKSFPIDPIAQTAKSVNTVKYVNGIPHGWSTDGEGFVRAYEERYGQPIKGHSVCVLGSGGSAKAIAIAVRPLASRLTLMARRKEKAEEIAELCRKLAGAGAVEAVDLEHRITDCQKSDIVVNCTSVGMKPDDVTNWHSNCFRAGHHFVDLIYVTPQTLMMEVARVGGAEVENGLGMLLHQGAKQYEIWTGRKADTSVMRAALEQALYGGCRK